METLQEEEHNEPYVNKWYLSIKNDITNLNIFWKEHKKTIYWIFFVFVLTQYVGVVGGNGDRVNKGIKCSVYKQRGGQGEGGAGGAGGAAATAGSASAAPTTGKFQSFRTTGPMSNIFGRFGAIFGNAFKILGIILLIAVFGFLPIIIMIVFTYKVIRHFAGKVRGL